VLRHKIDCFLELLGGFGQVLEIMNPRIARLGFRLVF